MRAIGLGSLYFALVFLAGFVLGTLRVFVVAPAVGPDVAVLIELPFILGISWLVCGRLLRGRRLTKGEAAVMGIVAFVLLMIAEAVLSVTWGGLSLSAHFAAYRQAPQLVGLVGQIAFAAFPGSRRLS